MKEQKRRRKIGRQRNKLYALIRNDEITRIFEQKSKMGRLTADNVNWGGNQVRLLCK
jgi:hypothetical protein